MTVSYANARNEMFALLKANWDANSGAIAGSVPKVFWQGVEETTPAGNVYWARASISTVDSEQTSLSTCVGEPGQRRYTEYGLIFLQIFCPKSQGNAFKVGSQLAELARGTFRGKTTPGHVWFRNSRINELPLENLYIRFNVVAEFEYDEIM